MSLVSVIIPAYNSESSLSQCIDSVLNQSYKPVQIIVINDGSTDRTVEIAKSYGEQIHYIEQENKGQGAARNAGLKVATGEFIAFLDSDDYWEQDFLINCVNFLNINPDISAVFTSYAKQYSNGTSEIRPAIAASESCQKKGPQILNSFYKFWADHYYIQTGAVVISSKVIKLAGGMREDLRISQDLEYWSHIANHGRWGFIPIPLLISTSEKVVPKGGWVKKYSNRRKLCPTVEQWQSRIINNITKENMPYFKVIRGKIAAGYLYAKISAGDNAGAKHIINKYKNEMPLNSLTKWGRRFQNMGTLSWNIFCWLVRFRESMKAFR